MVIPNPENDLIRFGRRVGTGHQVDLVLAGPRSHQRQMTAPAGRRDYLRVVDDASVAFSPASHKVQLDIPGRKTPVKRDGQYPARQ